MANRLIFEGVIESYEKKLCEYYAQESRIVQCFNCHEYRHIKITCTKLTACGQRGEPHNTKLCEKDPSVKRYANCNNQGHEAWSYLCPVRIREKEKGKHAYDMRPFLYPVAIST
jgi:hypothetical protein